MLIGLDGLTLSRLLPLVRQGELPTFARLLARGSYGVLRSVTNMTTGPTWASFATGCTPARHGIHHDFHHRRDAYALEATSGRDLQVKTLWQVASGAGKRVVVLNPPMSYPAQPVNGVLLAGIDAPSEHAPGFCHPPDAYRKLKAAGVDYIIDCGLASYMQSGQVEAGWAAVERETEGRTRAAEKLLSTIDWNLFVTVYSLPDVWQHYYWTAPQGAPGAERITAAHRLLDAHLERLLAFLPPDGSVIVFSDHGFGPLHATRDALNRWLAAQGLLTFLPTGQRSPIDRIIRRLRSMLRSRVSFRARQQLLAMIRPLRRRVETALRMGDIDFARTQVYAAVDHLELWLNVRGRQPQGVIDPQRRDVVAQKVASRLKAWRDPASGEPYVTDVHVHGQAAHKSHLLPDLSLTWNPHTALPDLHPLITGDHEMEGTVIMAGPGLPKETAPEMRLIDIAPTVLSLLEIPRPPWMEGRCHPA